MKYIVLFLFLLATLIGACGPDEQTPVQFDPSLYSLDFGTFPNPNLPADNLPTNAGVQLGRMLFMKSFIKGWVYGLC